MTLEETLAYGREQLQKAGIADAALDAWYLLEYIGKFDKSYYYLHGREEMDEEALQNYQVLVKKRAERVPLQYITGVQMFMGLEFKVNPYVLIPRQDTETLVEAALAVCKPGMRVLDLCTGSGCILISLLHLVEGLVGVGSDISKQALLVARENAKANDVDAEWVRSDLFSNLSGTFDVIVSNPPYIPSRVIDTLMPEVRDFEPVEALDGHEDGLFFYDRILEECHGFLNPGGYLMFEIGYDQGEAVSERMRQAGFLDVQVIRDLCGNNRVVRGNMPGKSQESFE